ncbi:MULTISPECIES: hypothetical protein [Streptomyces]|uniref:Uncharacterized protein n=2 Tax=Streptomyces TaxID=1883 RepID=A0A0W7XAH0_9ACTN|nr:MULTISPECIES: hypothetical protein [Streptomyces]KUF19760.1 hypothetical protein AT728_05265 [Streptomyces silvensis]MVO87829.1 hypothetical protein [Streptomyces typhae]
MYPAKPALGSTVRDGKTGALGHVMGHEGPYVQLRPLAGGKEWDADPARVEPVDATELLSARVAVANERSWKASKG